MAKHKLYRQFESTSPLSLSPSEEISPKRDVHPSAPDTQACVRSSLVKSKCADKSATSKKRENKEEVTDKELNLSSSESSPDGDCVSLQNEDTDSDGFFSYCRSGLKVPYSAKEDEWILKFLLKGQNVTKVGSISLWKHLESKKENPKRTYHSLKNRFLRNIKPHIFTRYGHLISNDGEIQRILAKFPELRCKVGRTNTLSRIQLPARSPNSKFGEGELVKRSRYNDERVPSPRTCTSESPPKGSVRQELILNMNFSNFERKVAVKDESLEVWVNFNSKQQLHKPVTPPIGIYERYEKCRKKNKLVLCGACGRYNQPRKNKLADTNGNGESLNFSAGRQVLTANSSGADPGNSSDADPGNSSGAAPGNSSGAASGNSSGADPGNSSGADPGNSSDAAPGNASGADPRNSSDADPGNSSGAAPGNSSGADPGNSSVTSSGSPPAKCRKVGSSGLSSCTTLSPSLLRNAGEERDSPFGWTTQERPLKTGEVGRAPIPVALTAVDRLREAYNDLDSTYDDTVADFKRLIKNEEEQLLVRKCLHGKSGILGLSESISQNSMESYFVDLSQNLDTPALTVDCSTANRQPNEVGEGGNSGSLLARNMMKMLKNKMLEKS